MSDQKKLSERIKKWNEQEGPVYFARDQAAMWKTQAETLEEQLAGAQACVANDTLLLHKAHAERDQAIRERDEARIAAYQDAIAFKAQRDALAKALRLAINTVECASVDLKEGPNKGQDLPWYKAAREALAALERTAPADGGKP